jgi:DNA mismatch endonuclease (patch repair protein)
MASQPHMRKVRSKDTQPEMSVRRLLWAMGFRGYRIHYISLPGKPDIVFTRRKKVIFVHGCFWYGHNCRAGMNVPKSNSEYWQPKLARNRRRDQQNQEELQALGWRFMIIWECELRDLRSLEERIRDFLRP